MNTIAEYSRLSAAKHGAEDPVPNLDQLDARDRRNPYKVENIAVNCGRTVRCSLL